MRCLPVIFILISFSLEAQILNGSFEEWEFYNNSEIPTAWDTYIYWADYSDYIVKDASSYEGEYALKLIGGEVYSEGDCLRQVTGKFHNEYPDADSLLISFAYKSVAQNVNNRTDFRMEVNGNFVFGSKEPQEDYVYYSFVVENPEQDSIIINMESHRFGASTDGCPEKSDHWIDAVTLTTLLSSIDDKLDKVDNTFYPNPTKGLCYISFEDENFTVNLYDMTGRRVVSKMNEKTLDLSEIDVGIYLFEIEDASGKTVYSEKLIKE